jgi:predicted DNA-binding ribbon-helix-helix protein
MQKLRHLRSHPPQRDLIESKIGKRSVVIAGHHTSVSLEQTFWIGLKEAAAARNITVNRLVTQIDAQRERVNLSSALRVFVLEFYRDRIEQHRRRDSAA